MTTGKRQTDLTTVEPYKTKCYELLPHEALGSNKSQGSGPVVTKTVMIFYVTVYITRKTHIILIGLWHTEDGYWN